MGTCYPSDECGVGCEYGYQEVARSGLCEHLCCVPGASFWYDKCFEACPVGFHSVAKRPSCWDLCAPIQPPAGRDAYPGAADGFVRGLDASGAEVYRYEQNNQVYVIPAQQYYVRAVGSEPTQRALCSHSVVCLGRR